MKLLSLEQELSSNAYPGRGIVLGLTPDGTHAVAAYFIMGRSVNSRNRVFVEDGEGIRTQAFDPSKLSDPSLIIYAPVRVLGNKTIVTNGDQTDTMIQNTGSSNSETTLDKYNYLPNETVQNIEHEVGAVEPDQSSIGIVLTKYNVIKEETLESQGLLKDTTFEEYVNNNSAVTDLQVPQELITLVSAATGIATNNITIQIKQKPVYEAKESSSFMDNASNYLMVILTLLIAGLLVFVIIKGTSPVEVTELEPELSVEDLLATTQEDDKQDLDEIELSDKSETRQLIEKFVDENPEAVALLLRNWINEDWGA